MDLEKFIPAFMEQKMYYDALSQAVRLAKASGVDEVRCRSLIAEKTIQKEAYIAGTEKLVRAMDAARNIIQLSEDWYAIRYISDRNILAVKPEVVNSRDLHLLERDCLRERDLTRTELDTLIPALINVAALEKYKAGINVMARNLLQDKFGIILDESTEVGPLVTFHAGVRWVQRVLNFYANDEKKAEDYRRANSAEIDRNILEAFLGAQLVWAADDGVEYFFDDNNIMYVKNDNSIVTLYESNFGFAKHINRSIVLEQIKVITEQHQLTLQREIELDEEIQAINDEAQGISDQLATLEAEIQALIAKRNNILSRREEMSKELVVEKSRLQAECNKLFKKY